MHQAKLYFSSTAEYVFLPEKQILTEDKVMVGAWWFFFSSTDFFHATVPFF